MIAAEVPPQYCEYVQTQSACMRENEDASITEIYRDSVIKPLAASYSLSMTGRGVVNDIISLLSECSERGWDGYDANPISQDAVVHAVRLIQSLPVGLPGPSVAPEPQGSVNLEWYAHPSRLLIASIGEDGHTYYAALNGRNSSLKGVETNREDAAKRITQLLHILQLA